MLRPTDIEKLKGKESRYAVVVGIAKRARDIAEKPVSMAIQDFSDGEYKLIVPRDTGEDDHR